MVDYVAFGIIIDDIVFPDGTTRMGILGGGGSQAAFGMRLWSDSVGLVAGVGNDLPADALTWLESCGINLEGIRTSEIPTPRAWQAMEEDGQRTQVWRIDPELVGMQLERTMVGLPPSYRNARGFHLGIHPLEPDLDFISALSRLGGVVSIEPFKPSDRLLSLAEANLLLSKADIFSPNLLEAQSMFGQASPASLLVMMCDLGSSVIALRLGSEGSFLMEEPEEGLVSIPALPVRLVDPVGAGNAYCGGFLVGWTETRDLVTAGLYGTVSASFLVEQVGLPQMTPGLRQEAARRLEVLRQGVKSFFSGGMIP
jgi:cytidine kinase